MEGLAAHIHLFVTCQTGVSRGVILIPSSSTWRLPGRSLIHIEKIVGSANFDTHIINFCLATVLILWVNASYFSLHLFTSLTKKTGKQRSECSQERSAEKLLDILLICRMFSWIGSPVLSSTRVLLFLSWQKELHSSMTRDQK